ncbi:MAG TPA: DUF5009 domain-containing protein [Verrucomicrobiales bacterium]|nr:DUF5009 domain-containing protein [Verrucomicrobiales bacterium]
MSASPSPAAIKPTRLSSIDAYRGLVMFLMLAEVMRVCSVSGALPGSEFWGLLCYHQSHVEWVGCSLHDLIQPSFSFLVGVALPFSIASRAAYGSSFGRMFGHAVWRALLLIFLGIFLRSIGRSQTYFTFEDTLTQIGLGYVFLFLLGFRSGRVQWAALAFILVGYWLAFALYPLPGPDFDWSKAGVAADWSHHANGFAAHWNKNTNLAWAFDNWWMNLFPRETAFQYNGGGYATLSFIPTLGTMILGLIAGTWLKADLKPATRTKRFVIAGVIGLAAGWLLDVLGICPNVKRIWTPSWVLFSGGWCFLFLAFFHWIMDLKGWKRWAFPLTVIGMNSIFAYCSEWLFVGFLRGALNTHLGADFFNLFGEPYVRFFQGASVVLIIWLMLLWLYRKRVFIKI